MSSKVASAFLLGVVRQWIPSLQLNDGIDEGVGGVSCAYQKVATRSRKNRTKNKRRRSPGAEKLEKHGKRPHKRCRPKKNRGRRYADHRSPRNKKIQLLARNDASAGGFGGLGNLGLISILAASLNNAEEKRTDSNKTTVPRSFPKGTPERFVVAQLPTSGGCTGTATPRSTAAPSQASVAANGEDAGLTQYRSVLQPLPLGGKTIDELLIMQPEKGILKKQAKENLVNGEAATKGIPSRKVHFNAVESLDPEKEADSTKIAQTKESPETQSTLQTVAQQEDRDEVDNTVDRHHDKTQTKKTKEVHFTPSTDRREALKEAVQIYKAMTALDWLEKGSPSENFFPVTNIPGPGGEQRQLQGRHNLDWFLSKEWMVHSVHFLRGFLAWQSIRWNTVQFARMLRAFFDHEPRDTDKVLKEIDRLSMDDINKLDEDGAAKLLGEEGWLNAYRYTAKRSDGSPPVVYPYFTVRQPRKLLPGETIQAFPVRELLDENLLGALRPHAKDFEKDFENRELCIIVSERRLKLLADGCEYDRLCREEVKSLKTLLGDPKFREDNGMPSKLEEPLKKETPFEQTGHPTLQVAS